MNKNKNIFKAITTLGLGLCAITILSLGTMVPSSIANAMSNNQSVISSNNEITLTGGTTNNGSTSIMSSSDYVSSTKTSISTMSTSSLPEVESSKMNNMINTIKKAVESEIKVLDKAPGKDLDKDSSLIILKERRTKSIRTVTIKYIVLNLEQMTMLNKKLPEMNQIFQDASNSSNLAISINCNVSYPPLKIKCTIDISW